jgi:hypothetical protein
MLKDIGRQDETIYLKLAGKMVRNSATVMVAEGMRDEMAGGLLLNVIEAPTFNDFKNKYGSTEFGKFFVALVENFSDVNYAIMEGKTDEELEKALDEDEKIDKKLDEKMDEELKDVPFTKNVKDDVAEIIVDDEKTQQAEAEKEKKLATTLDEDMPEDKKVKTDIPEDAEEKEDILGDEAEQESEGDSTEDSDKVDKKASEEFGFEVPAITESVTDQLREARGLDFDIMEAVKITEASITALRFAQVAGLMTPDRRKSLQKELHQNISEVEIVTNAGTSAARTHEVAGSGGTGRDKIGLIFPKPDSIKMEKNKKGEDVFHPDTPIMKYGDQLYNAIKAKVPKLRSASYDIFKNQYAFTMTVDKGVGQQKLC